MGNGGMSIIGILPLSYLVLIQNFIYTVTWQCGFISTVYINMCVFIINVMWIQEF